ncbi:MAG: putative YggU family [Patescibacteria group bacterium]|nr:putative YggU family [Patescibacteria group bacterium]
MKKIKKIAVLQEEIANNKEVFFTIKAFANAGENSVKETPNGEIQVQVTSSATDGKANVAIVKILASTLGLRRYQVEIIKGLTSRLKTIKISR